METTQNSNTERAGIGSTTLFDTFGLTRQQAELLLRTLPRDRNGVPIMPSEEYTTTQGVKTRARYIVTFDVTVLDGNRFRTTTEADVYLSNVQSDRIPGHEENPQ